MAIQAEPEAGGYKMADRNGKRGGQNGKQGKNKGGQGFKKLVMEIPKASKEEIASINKLIERLPQELFRKSQAAAIMASWLDSLEVWQKAQFYANASKLDEGKLLELLKDLALLENDAQRNAKVTAKDLFNDGGFIEEASTIFAFCLEHLRNQMPPQTFVKGKPEAERLQDWQDMVDAFSNWSHLDQSRLNTIVMALAPLSGSECMDVLTKLVVSGLDDNQKLTYLKGLMKWPQK